VCSLTSFDFIRVFLFWVEVFLVVCLAVSLCSISWSVSFVSENVYYFLNFLYFVGFFSCSCLNVWIFDRFRRVRNYKFLLNYLLHVLRYNSCGSAILWFFFFFFADSVESVSVSFCGFLCFFFFGSFCWFWAVCLYE